MTLNFDILTSLSMRAEGLSCLPSLVLTALAVFVLERGHTDRHTHKFTKTTVYRAVHRQLNRQHVVRCA